MILKPRLFRKPNFGHPLARSLVGLWVMNEGSGSKVFDLSGNGNIGTLVADTHFVPGKFGSSLSFDGGDDCISLGAKTWQAPFSIVLWVKVDQLSATIGRPQIFMGKWVVNDKCWEFDYGDAGSNCIGLAVSDGDNTNGTRNNANSVVIDSTTEWFHVAATCNGVDEVCLYVNGVADSGNPHSNTHNGSNVSSNVYIGKMQYEGAERYLDGKIDHVMIYNRALSVSEIALLYREPFCMFERDPIELWSAATIGAPSEGNVGIMTPNAGYWGPTF